MCESLTGTEEKERKKSGYVGFTESKTETSKIFRQKVRVKEDGDGIKSVKGRNRTWLRYPRYIQKTEDLRGIEELYRNGAPSPMVEIV